MNEQTHTGPRGASPERGLPLVASVARALTAASVLLSAVVHLELWAAGMSRVEIIGPLFGLNAVGGLVIGVAVLVWRHWLTLLAAAGFGALTLGAAILSVTVGLFGVQETGEGIPFLLSAISETTAVVFALVAWGAERQVGRRPAQVTSSANATMLSS